MNPTSPPYPPMDIAHRVGSLEAVPDPWAFYDAIGRRGREDILAALPGDFTLDDKRRVVAERARQAVETSRSWKLSAPLRGAAAQARRRRS
jgi:hypothetical protein